MKKRTRTALFIICLLLFLLAAPSVILYSQGYRFDFVNKKITQTGAFYSKVLPRGAEVYLNGKFKNNTSFFNNSLLIENLIPGKYAIEIRKEGYYSWKKTVEIIEKQVNEAKHIILFPENVNLELATKDPIEIQSILEEIKTEKKEETPKELADLNFNDYLISPDGKKIAYFTDHEIILMFLDNQYDLQKSSGEKIFLTRFSENIDNIFWIDSYYILFNVGDKIKISEVDNRDKLNMIDLLEIKNPKIHWDQNMKILYILSDNSLYKINNLLP